MADVEMPKSVSCKFDARGWNPCKKPSDNGWCSEHEKLKCVSCGERAVRNCDHGMGGLSCGAPLCDVCQHSLEDNTHVGKLVYQIQFEDKMEFEATGKESARMLALRGVPTHVPLPANLEELLTEKWKGTFNLKTCFYLQIKHSLSGTFPAILKGTKIAIITLDKASLIRVWKSLRPADSELVAGLWMVNEEIGVAYRLVTDDWGKKNSVPQKLFSAGNIDAQFKEMKAPFQWAPGIIGAEVSKERFEQIIFKQIRSV